MLGVNVSSDVNILYACEGLQAARETERKVRKRSRYCQRARAIVIALCSILYGSALSALRRGVVHVKRTD